MRRIQLPTVVLVLMAVMAGMGAGVAGSKPEPVPEPTTWSNLRWLPARPLLSLGPGSTCGALAIAERRLLLAEVHSGGVYLSEVDPGTATARWSLPVAAAVSGRERTRVQVAVVRDLAWVAWLEGAVGAGTEAPRALKLSSVDLATRRVAAPVVVATTTDVGAASHNQQLWLAWLNGGEAGTVSVTAASEALSIVPWKPPTPGRPVAVALGDMGACLSLPFLVREPERESLWIAECDGPRFRGVRKLRSARDLDSPAVCLLRNRMLLLYTEHVGPERGDLALTVTSVLGGDSTTVPYLADGHRNLYPSLAAREGTAYLVYTAWQGANNPGLFLGEIESTI